MSKHVIILGGGVSGLGAAWRLAERGLSVELLEASPAVGGLAGTVSHGGYHMDYGPHSFFSDDRSIVDTVTALFDGGLPSTPRKVKFYFEGKYIDYPLTARSALFQLGLGTGLRSALSFLRAALVPAARPASADGDETVEEWAISSFGDHLYRTFFKPYTEQFWKVPCSELSSRSIPTHTRMSFTNTLRLLLRRKQGSLGESLVEREMMPTYYPDGGFADIAEKMAAAVVRLGGRIRTGCPVEAVRELPGGGAAVGFREGGERKERRGDFVLSTVPLPLLAEMLEPRVPRGVSEAAGKLEFRSLVVLGMVTTRQDVLDGGYIYLLNRPYNRMFEMNSFSPRTSPEGENIIGVEIPCLRDSAAFRAAKEELFDMCIGSLSEDGFLFPGDVKDLLIARAPNAYPIYRTGYASRLAKVLAHVGSRPSVATLGRCGEFMYMDIDECIKRSFAAAEALAGRLGDGERGRAGR